MMNVWLNGYVWIAIILLVVIFILSKVFLIFAFGLKKKLPTIFFFSLRHVNLYMIHNFTNGVKKKYFTLSNALNAVFYVGIAGVIFVYIFFNYVVE